MKKCVWARCKCYVPECPKGRTNNLKQDEIKENIQKECKKNRSWKRDLRHINQLIFHLWLDNFNVQLTMYNDGSIIIKWIQGCLFESRCNRTLQMYSQELRETEFWTVMNSRDVNYHILFYAALIPCTSKCNLINKPNK